MYNSLDWPIYQTVHICLQTVVQLKEFMTRKGTLISLIFKFFIMKIKLNKGLQLTKESLTRLEDSQMAKCQRTRV